MNTMRMMHKVDASMQSKNGKIFIDNPFAANMPLQKFSRRLGEKIATLGPDDSGVSFAPVIFCPETSKRYPFFKASSGMMSRMADYSEDEVNESKTEFVNHQMTKTEFDELNGDIIVLLFNMDDGRRALSIDRFGGNWRVSSADFKIDEEDAPGLHRIIEKILQADTSSYVEA